SRRLECVAGPLTAQVAARQTAQLAINERRQLIAGALISLIPGDQQSSDFIRRRSHLCSSARARILPQARTKSKFFYLCKCSRKLPGDLERVASSCTVGGAPD